MPSGPGTGTGKASGLNLTEDLPVLNAPVGSGKVHSNPEYFTRIVGERLCIAFLIDLRQSGFSRTVYLKLNYVDIISGLEQEIDTEITHIGLRAHEFIPVWGEREDNCIPVKEKGKAEFPFEWKYFLKGETEESDDICWYVQKNLWDELTEKGIPDYLKLPEKEILLLK